MYASRVGMSIQLKTIYGLSLILDGRVMTSREWVASTTYVASVLALPAHFLFSSTLGGKKVFLRCV